MKRISYFLVVIITLSFLGACGGSGGSGSSAPTVSSVKDGNAVAVETTATTDVNPTTLDITFSKEMDDTSVTTADNVTLTCTLPEGSGVSQPTIVVAASTTTANTYTVTVTDAWKYALLSCVLTVTTNVTDAGGTALAAAATYTFTNSCAVGDDFNADSQSCWTALDTSGSEPAVTGWANWDSLLNTATGILDFDTTSSALNYNATAITGTSYGLIYKEVTVDPSGFQMIIYIPSFSGMLNDAGAIFDDELNIELSANISPEAPGKYIKLALVPTGTSTQCTAVYIDDGELPPTAVATAACPSGSAYYMKLLVEDSTITVQYKTDDTTYEDLTVALGAFPTDQDFTDTSYLKIAFQDGANTGVADDNVAEIGWISISGITVTDQY